MPPAEAAGIGRVAGVGGVDPLPGTVRTLGCCSTMSVPRVPWGGAESSLRRPSCTVQPHDRTSSASARPIDEGAIKGDAEQGRKAPFGTPRFHALLPGLAILLSAPCRFGDSAHAEHARSLVEGGLPRPVRGIHSSAGELVTASRSCLVRRGAAPWSSPGSRSCVSCRKPSEQGAGRLRSAPSPVGSARSHAMLAPVVGDVLRRAHARKTTAAATTPSRGPTSAMVFPLGLDPPLEERR